MNERPNFPPTSKSLVAKFLTPEMWQALSPLRDEHGFGLEQAIASGVQNPDSSIGMYAGSHDSYRVFAPLFDKVIQAYHGDQTHREGMQPEAVPVLAEADQAAVRSTRIRVARNLANLPLGPAVSDQQRKQVEAQVVDALQSLDGDLAGTYFPLESMDEATRARLTEDHFLFKQGDRYLESAGLNRDWPSARGIFHNHDKTFLVWVNEEDHIRIISMQQGGDVRAVFDRLKRAVDHLETRLEFAADSRLGNIASCPTNLGTSLRASVHVHLPNLGEAEKEQLAALHHVQVRGVHGEHSDSEGGFWDVSNKRRLGFQETELVSDMVCGVEALLAADRATSRPS